MMAPPTIPTNIPSRRDNPQPTQLLMHIYIYILFMFRAKLFRMVTFQHSKPLHYNIVRVVSISLARTIIIIIYSIRRCLNAAVYSTLQKSCIQCMFIFARISFCFNGVYSAYIGFCFFIWNTIHIHSGNVYSYVYSFIFLVVVVTRKVSCASTTLSDVRQCTDAQTRMNMDFFIYFFLQRFKIEIDKNFVE